MTAFDFDQYISDYNTNDDEMTVRRWYAPSILIEDGIRRMEGHQQILKFLRLAHDGVRETLKPLCVLGAGDRYLAELDIILEPLRDIPDYPLGPMTTGHSIRMRFHTAYRVSEGVITNLNLAFWPPVPAEHSR